MKPSWCQTGTVFLLWIVESGWLRNSNLSKYRELVFLLVPRLRRAPFARFPSVNHPFHSHFHCIDAKSSLNDLRTPILKSTKIVSSANRFFDFQIDPIRKQPLPASVGAKTTFPKVMTKIEINYHRIAP